MKLFTFYKTNNIMCETTYSLNMATINLLKDIVKVTIRKRIKLLTILGTLLYGAQQKRITTLTTNRYCPVLHYQARLSIVGTGYFVSYDSAEHCLSFLVGLSHPIVYKLPLTISVTLRGKKNRIILFRTFSLNALETVTNELRRLKKKDVYHGKGLKYTRFDQKLKKGKKKFA